MSDSKQTDSDRAMARLLAEALRRPVDAASGIGCPDAEILAAYAEHNLDAAETSQWEKHFADCGRCQKILAVLTVSGEEPLTGAELERFGRKVAAVEVGAPVTASSSGKNKVTPFARPQTAWPWLASAVGIAAAVALWIALRPIPRPVSVAVTAQNNATEPAAPPSPNESLEARANVPPPPAAAQRDAEQQAATSLELAPALKKENAPLGQSTDAAARQERAAPQANDEAQVARTQPTLQSQSEPVLQAANKPIDDLAKAKQSENAVATRSATLPSAAPEAAAAAVPPPPSAVPSPPPAASPDANLRVAAPQSSSDANSAQTASAGNTTRETKAAPNRTVQLFSARQALGGIAATSPGRVVTVTSPSKNISWRLGPGGMIQRSTDRGQSWHPEPSGVTTDLTGGAAPSEDVVWIVGRAGVILRTTDGEHWQRIPSPDPSANWASVQATDAQHATISDGSLRFATADDGQTWKQQ